MLPQRLPMLEGEAMIINFFVPGVPKTAGSKKYVGHTKKTNKPIIVDDCEKGGDWRAAVQAFAMKAYRGPLLSRAVYLQVSFYFSRPKGHYYTGKKTYKILHPSAPEHHIIKPDTTKLLRAVEDALKGVIWHDDSQVIKQLTCKDYVCRYGEDKPGAYVYIEEYKDARFYRFCGVRVQAEGGAQ